ncbi:nematode resistance protein-like HSPRO2 [Cornus florida]|uniref:nematode resistance protein-like HSPRO2 n=1 Tax=Cornus florida TaxID=4283 RepID=UPI00289920D2|nr:nematode resistance protein-like HSPRO2 [Cornus florida]
MVHSDLPNKSPKLLDKLRISAPYPFCATDLSPVSNSMCSRNHVLIRLHRFFDPRLYANRQEWNRRLESVSLTQVHLIALICDDGESGGIAPIVDLSSSEAL